MNRINDVPCENLVRIKAFVVVLCFGLSANVSADSLRIAIPSNPGFLDPAYWSSTSEQILIDNLYPRLAKYAPGKEWKTELDAAKSVDLSDPQHIKFELKPGIMWTGGYGELTAEDVEFSFERHTDPDTASYAAAEFSLLEDVEVTGRYTGTIHLSAPSPSFWTASLVYTSGAIVSKKAAEKAGGFFENTPLATAGPYKFKSAKPGQNFTLEKDPNWNGTPGSYDEVVLIPLEEDNAAIIAFEADEIDYTRLSTLQYDLYVTNPPRGGEITLAHSVDPLWLGISENHEKLKDSRVRRAIQLAIDVPSILAATTNNRSIQANGVVPFGLLGHLAGQSIERDVATARKLIEEADMEGLELRLDYVNFTSRSTTAQIIQANLAEIGISVDLNAQDEGTFWSIDAASADLQLHLKSWTGNPDGLYMMQYFTSDQVGLWNWEGMLHPEYDELVAKAKAELNDSTRERLYLKMQEIMKNSGDFVFITHESSAVLAREGMTVGTLPDGRPVFGAFVKPN